MTVRKRGGGDLHVFNLDKQTHNKNFYLIFFITAPFPLLIISVHWVLPDTAPIRQLLYTSHLRSTAMGTSYQQYVLLKYIQSCNRDTLAVGKCLELKRKGTWKELWDISSYQQYVLLKCPQSRRRDTLAVG